ncbi:MurR/RpiR family transcriptional regulator [Streptomyces sp. NPDC057438]|uniref:MurR/RpiR family transcriptional regulator n=1 Tax=Streptomyces sp. NPDC057438 TaxID=3346133 RepID=UPI0036BC6DC7
MSDDVKEIFAAAAGQAAGRPAEGRSGSATTSSTPPAPAALAAKVRTLAPSMTRSMQRVAEAVANDPAACAALTVTGLAELTGTSEATVVRTARLLGYPGYRDLRLALAGLAAHQQSGRAPSVTADIAVDDPLSDVVAKLAYDEQQTLADTAAGLDMAQLGAAVGALAGARRIDIYGVGASGLVAQDLTQKLLRIGLIAHAHSDPHLAVTNAVQLRAKDVAVAITHSGSTGDVIEPLRVAFDHGATTIAVTGRPDGPVSQYADHVLTTSTARESELRPAAMSSRTSQLLVVDCLFVGVAQRTYESAAPALSASYEALAHRHRTGGPSR